VSDSLAELASRYRPAEAPSTTAEPRALPSLSQSGPARGTAPQRGRHQWGYGDRRLRPTATPEPDDVYQLDAMTDEELWA